MKNIQDLLDKLSIPDSVAAQLSQELNQLGKQLKRKDFVIKRLKKDKEITEGFLNTTIKELEENNKQWKEYQQKELDQKEKQIKSKDTQLKQITDSMPSSLAYVDRNYCYQINNSLYQKWFGKQNRDLQNKHVSTIVGEHIFNSKIKSLLDRTFAGEKIEFEAEYTSYLNQILHLKVTYVPAYNDDGKNIGVYVFGEDITTLKQQQKDLETSQEKLRDLFDNVYEAIIELDIEGYISNYNKAAVDFFGIKKDVPFFILSMVDPDDAEKVKTYFELLKTQGYYENYQGRFISPSGKTIHIEVSSVAKYDEKGEMIGSRHIVRDITEKIKVEKALKASESKYKSLVENNHFGIIQTDINGMVTYSSPRSDEITGLINGSDKSLNRMNFTNSITPEELPSVMAQLNKLITGKIPYDIFRQKIIRQDGNLLFVEGTSILLKDENDVPYGINIVYNDATEKVKAEQELAEKNKELKKYIESNLQLENFARLASHDLREPLLNIFAFTNLLQEEYNDHIGEMGKTYLSYIQQSSKRMETLINDLLKYATIGKYSQPESINLNELVQNIFTDFLASIQNNNVNIEVYPLPTIKGHQTELRSLFQNLISNAIKYQNPGTPLHIFIQAVSKDNTWQFSVSDNGIGIAPEHHEQIFIIYKRLDSGYKHKNSTGIGLAHCKKVVELHGGKIWVTSELNVGTNIHFTLNKHTDQATKNTPILEANAELLKN
ncbi:MAG: PAS domain S-box protein [Chitinophagales bacterium]